MLNGVGTLAVSTEELDSVGLPNSLQGAVVMQLDNLTPQCAACVKAASVMGMAFPAVALSALLPENTDIVKVRRGRSNSRDPPGPPHPPLCPPQPLLTASYTLLSGPFRGCL